MYFLTQGSLYIFHSILFPNHLIFHLLSNIYVSKYGVGVGVGFEVLINNTFRFSSKLSSIHISLNGCSWLFILIVLFYLKILIVP